MLRCVYIIRACSSSGRALHSHCRGKGSESPQVHNSFTGCGIVVLRALRVRVTPVRFRAARLKSRELSRFFLFFVTLTKEPLTTIMNLEIYLKNDSSIRKNFFIIYD